MTIPLAFGATGTINLASVLPNLSTNIDIEGPGANLLTVRRDTGGYYRIFTVSSGATDTLSGLTITNGAARTNMTDSGSGIANSGTLTLNNVVISGNQAPQSGVAGGIYNGGNLTLNYSTVSYNDGGGGAGGIENDGVLMLNNSTVKGNRAGWTGGGILNTRVLTLNNSTVSGNTADAWGEGGGIWNADTGTLTLNNSTVSGNTALIAGVGGGILNNGTATVTASTISGNYTDTDGAWGGIGNTGTLTLTNTIVARNLVSGTPQDIGGSVEASSSHNLVGVDSDLSGISNGTNGNKVGTAFMPIDPNLGPLQDNGGPTQTMALLPGSPAIDAGNNAGAPQWDQRGPGFPRIVNGTIDIGAYELQSQQSQAITTTILSSSSPNPLVFGQSVTFTATVTSGAGTPTGGTVTFKDGATTLGTGTLSVVNGVAQATFTTSTLAVGNHSLTAVYSGYNNFTGSTSSPLTRTVNPAATATTLVAAPDPSDFGQTVTFTATVSVNTPGAGTPTGTVTFKDGSTTLGTGTLDGTGKATLSTSTLSVATHSITVVYAGSANYSTSTSAALSQIVNKANTSTAIATSVNPSAFRQSVTFRATVTPSAGQRHPGRDGHLQGWLDHPGHWDAQQ